MATTQMIRTEPLPAQPRWTSLSGTILEGGYELQDLLEATDAKARFKVRVLGDRELESVAFLFQIPDSEIGRQIEIWQNVRMLRHPNLSAPLGAGRVQLDSVPLAYVVLRRADEALGAVLRERSLSREETGEAFTSAARALEALHLNGWVHGCLSPDLVLAVGEHIQLPGECVRTAGVAPAAEITAAKYLAPESAGVNLTPETDLWCLGATLFEALTQKSWTEESREELEALPEAFAAIASRCLETSPEARCSLAEAVALYRGELKLPPRVRKAANSSIIVPQGEIIAAPETPAAPPKPPNGSASNRSLTTPEPKNEQRPKTKLLVEDTTGAVETPGLKPPVDPEVAAMPAIAATPSNARSASVLAAQTLSTDGVDTELPKAAAMAALSPEAREAGTPSSSSTSAGSSETYPQPSLIARPNREETRRRSALQEEGESTNKLWIWAGLVLLVIALIWFFRPKHQAPAAVSNVNNKASLPAAAGSSSGSAWQTRTLGPGTATSGEKSPSNGSVVNSRNTAAKPAVSSSASAAVKPNSHPAAPKAASVPEKPASRGNIWRVVLYTYNRLPDAEKKARDLNARHSNLHAEVFSPPGGGSPYLVTTRGQSSRDEALQVRRKAIGAGMARDAYIQNYSR